MDATSADQAPAQTQPATEAPTAPTPASAPADQQQKQQQQQTQQQPASTENAPQKRQPIVTRDRHNQQSLGASLNTDVKQVRLLFTQPGFYLCTSATHRSQTR